MCLIGIADLKLEIRDKSKRCPQIREVKAILEEAGPKLESLEGVTSVHGPYYKTSATYLREVGDYASYYREALKFLGCSDLDKMSSKKLTKVSSENFIFFKKKFLDKEKTELAFCLGLAALLGENVYNFGELVKKYNLNLEK